MRNLLERTEDVLPFKSVFVNQYNAAVGACIAILTAIFGQYWYLFACFMFLNCLDWATGWAKARKMKMESSAAGLKGIIKKLWYWVLVLLAFVISGTFKALGMDLLQLDLSWMSTIGWFTLASLTINEARSILENLVLVGVKVPAFFIKGLAVAEKMLQDPGLEPKNKPPVSPYPASDENVE